MPMSHFAGTICLLALVLGPLACASAQEPREPLAVVNGQAITENDLDIEAELLQLRQKEYELRQNALEEAIAEKLIEMEARNREISAEELIEQEARSKIQEPTSEEVESFYEQQKHRIRRPLEEVRQDIVTALRRFQEREFRRELVDSLREKAEVKVLLDPPRYPVDLSRAPMRGPEDAPVTIVEFSDFQCPFCKRVQPALQQLREKYPDNVRWSFKDLPLVNIHSAAQKAAEAARCAGDQGKFWEYRDALFTADRITLDMHPGLAENLALDTAEFQECLDSRKYRAQVEADSQEAQKLGISGTPAFLVNGILLSGAQPYEEFEAVVEQELARAN